MGELVILVGLPGAGKSTFYRRRFAATHDHVSKDLLRNNRKPPRRQEQLIADALRAGRSVVVDNTNAAAKDRAPLIALGRAHGAAIVGYYLPTDVRDALRRNHLRQERERVPAVAIFATRKRLQPPSRDEGFDEVFEVQVREDTGGFDVRAGGGDAP